MPESSPSTLFSRLLENLGLTRAVSWSILTQAVRLLTGPITLLFYVKYLDVETQGYVYTFGSVIATSIFLEVGFSQNILQFASHEYAKLKFSENGMLKGDQEALSRLISLGRLSVKYYFIASVLFILTLIIGGEWFFATSSAQTEVNWRTPWYITCVLATISLLLNPCWSLLEGCNQVESVQKYRFLSSILNVSILFVGLSNGWNLYSLCLSSFLLIIVTLLYFGIKWRMFFAMFLRKPQHGEISWRKEIWPFQWRIAVSWMCGYFIFTSIIPIVFRIGGAVAAAQLGFALQMARLVSSVANSWSSAKLSEYGILASEKKYSRLRSMWKKYTILNLVMVVIGSTFVILAIEIFLRHSAVLNERYPGVEVLMYLFITQIAQTFVSCIAYYLRAFKEEPFVLISVIQAITSTVLIVILTNIAGVEGAALGHMLSSLIIIPLAYRIYNIKNSKLV